MKTAGRVKSFPVERERERKTDGPKDKHLKNESDSEEIQNHER